ncbi:LCP family protein [Sediminibacillus albus]|uniref:Cell envelope-related function transcriptional attenuator common domain-containing protein n=1 Tax=Sediminibacillus albus TaxID=407036 RepID=A0A1G9A3K1_9BACI|nr:LCP family protein [Sediminibacillus albus]SDK21424.1 cell envelope-related function transcriptional attenuator common domain-containing protein [Sediminibacillus albus]
MRRVDKKRRQRRKSNWKKVSLLILGIVIVGIGGFLFSIYSDIKNTVNDDLYEKVNSIDDEVTQQKINNQTPLNILLLGVDEREYDKGRSDTMIVMTLDPNNERMQMISIPRDTRTDIIGHGTVDKINHSYAFGGSDMAVDTVENFLDIELDYYIKVNMEGLQQLVNAVDGVTVNNKLAFKNGRFTFPEGELELNGREALAFVRMRKDDPKGDAGRNERQRQVIEGLIQKGASFSGVNRISDVMGVLGENVNTNMAFADMKRLMTDYRGARKNTHTYQVQGEGDFIGDIWYLIVAEQEVKKVHEMIKGYHS